LKKLYLDFETRSRADLRKVGAEKYAEEPSTHVHCAAWALAEGPIHLWIQGADLIDPEAPECAWLDLVREPSVMLVAHSCGFEKAILRAKFNLDVPVSRWNDTAARCARLSLPRSLEESALHLGLGDQKDLEGSRVMLKLARARKVSKENRDEFWNKATKPEDFERLYEYCKQDVVVMREIDKVVPELDEQERRVWELTMRMNDRGLKVDVGSIPIAEAVADHETHRLGEKFKALVGHGPSSPRAAAALGLTSLDKASVRSALKDAPVGGKLHEALSIRKLVARSSVKKLTAFTNRTCASGRIHGTLVYAGAERTLRWSGAGVQPHNFPRGMGEATDEAFTALRAGVFEEAYDDVLKALADILRGFFVGPFLVGDYAQIEARVLAWLAGQADLIQTFASGGDPYSEMASEIFGRPITKKSTDDSLPEGVTPRFIGKTVVLGCFSAETKVYTDAGLKRIVDVQASDMVWDGSTWVHHRGLLCQGEREVLCWQGIGVTPDHLVLTHDSWEHASQVVLEKGRLLESALSLGSSASSAGAPTSGTGGLSGSSSSESLISTKKCETYDLAFAGPRNRFAIYSDLGPLIVHNCGYGLGAKKFREQIDTVYDVQISEEFAEKCIRAFRKKYSAIPALWRKLEAGFAYAVQNRSKRVRVGPVFMGMVEISGREFAFIEMPNGRRMFYAYPKLNGEGRVEYLGRNLYKGGAWETVSTYGGKTTENLVQALSRDLLAAAMLRLDEAAFDLTLTVHDEIVAEGLAERLPEFEKILTEVPTWAAGLPLAVESFHSARYRK
jgi:hypothetical protein